MKEAVINCRKQAIITASFYVFAQVLCTLQGFFMCLHRFYVSDRAFLYVLAQAF